MRTLLRDVEVDGRAADVLVTNGEVAAVEPRGAVTRWNDVDEVVDGNGGALLPGLHDHHIHLLALAAELESVDCGPPGLATADALQAALGAAARTRPEGSWLRGTGYHESVAGPLDRHALDRLVSDRPVRIQHRSGALWMLNSAALAVVGRALPDTPDVERDAGGVPTGRLWRLDPVLRTVPTEPPSLAEVDRLLTSYGVTGVTDATPDLDAGTQDLLEEAVATGELRARLTLLGAAGPSRRGRVTLGPLKLLLHDHDLPDFDVLSKRVAAAHARGRPVAVHVVTRVSLLLTLAVLEDVGTLPGDRLEHGSVVPPEVLPTIRRLGLSVVTQPGFLRTRGEQYLAEVPADDLACLYPYASLVASRIPVAASSDAPYGELDPWQCIIDATSRTTGNGVALGRAERVPAARALAGYLSAPEAPGGRPRRVRPGAPADLCLLTEPLAEALRHPHRDLVRSVRHAATRSRQPAGID